MHNQHKRITRVITSRDSYSKCFSGKPQFLHKDLSIQCDSNSISIYGSIVIKTQQQTITAERYIPDPFNFSVSCWLGLYSYSRVNIILLLNVVGLFYSFLFSNRSNKRKMMRKVYFIQCDQQLRRNR